METNGFSGWHGDCDWLVGHRLFRRSFDGRHFPSATDGSEGDVPRAKHPSHPKTMNTITSWNPFRELEHMQDRILKAIHMSPVNHLPEERQELSSVQWTPRVDIAEDESAYWIKAELPEVPRDDVKVTVENGVLTIRGERKFKTEETTRKYHRIERAYGGFMRSLSIPEDANCDMVSAEFKDGVLSVKLPKCESRKPREVEVLVR